MLPQKIHTDWTEDIVPNSRSTFVLEKVPYFNHTMAPMTGHDIASDFWPTAPSLSTLVQDT